LSATGGRGPMKALSPEAIAVIEGRHADPFSYLGPHVDNGSAVLRVFLPDVQEVSALWDDGRSMPLDRIDAAGLFAGVRPEGASRYRLRARFRDAIVEMDDPYRFAPVLSDFDLYLLGEGNHLKLYDKVGAHPCELDDVAGVAFVVFAPNAQRVSVVGDFNSWDGRRHAMRVRRNGFWEIFVPGVVEGDRYKFDILGRQEEGLPLKADPVAFAAELRPRTASVVADLRKLQRPAAAPPGCNALDAPISIYEVHLGSWRRRPEEGHRWLTYRELADELPRYVRDMNFTHVEFLPVTEHPFDGSWGYQPTGQFAPTSRFGSPADFAALVDACHRAGLGVILDWVPGHFPDDDHGLARFDGTALYEHADPRQGRHLDWGTLIYNYGRTEVANFLLASALFWLDHYAIEALRVDAVASMLYLDYSRPEGDWIPNQHGGRENLAAVAFLKRFNTEAFAQLPETTTIAEESTSWPMVSRPVDQGGLGFGYKWNMGWMNDTLAFISKDSIHRKYHHHQITFGLLYAFSENFILPLSHDEVVHGKRSLLGRMPGDRWQRFANLRVYYGFMFGHPGKKLLFMGNEIAQEQEWRHEHSLDWHLLEQREHLGVQSLVRDLNALYRATPALHQRDCDAAGFEWLILDDIDNSVFAWLRKGRGERDQCLIIVNFTPQVLRDYRVPMPFSGVWREVLNTDAAVYGGSNVGNAGALISSTEEARHVLRLVVPPLAVVFLVREA
jgi:1,4-alpha-glucan branching enzyme